MTFFDALFEALPICSAHHAPTDPLYTLLKTVLQPEISQTFGSPAPDPHPFGPFGNLVFPHVPMGSVSSLNLFDLDECLIFAFYWANRHRYRHVADIGANLGLHSILLGRCGYHVRAYEPDPYHFKALKWRLLFNGCSDVEAVEAAVAHQGGQRTFVRVLGNTTASHLAGAKPHPYGELENITVEVLPFESVLAWADLIKMDVEGVEAELLCATTQAAWRKVDALVEVGSETNARAIFDHFAPMGVNLFVQKLGWKAATKPEEVPWSYRDGSLFITCKEAMPW